MVSENRRPTRHDQHETSGLPAPVLRSVVLRMNDAFPKLYEKWDVKGCMRKNWSLLFERLDTDKSGRLDYDEFKTALTDVLEIPIRSKDSKVPRKEGEIKEEELEGLWAYVDHDKSGEVTIDEFQHACYLLILDDWPVLQKATLQRICQQLNDACVHEYSKEGSGVTDGNWFKIFGHFDTDESGRMGFEELEGVTRMRDPGLNLSEADLTLDELRGLWRALDVDFSGLVDVDEFMHFMKDHGPQMHQLTEYSKQMRGLESRATTPSGATKEKKPKVEKKPGVYYQPKQKKRYTGRPNKAEARGAALAFSTASAFVDTFSDLAKADDGSKALLRRYAETHISGSVPRVRKPTPIKLSKRKRVVQPMDLDNLEAPRPKTPPPPIIIERDPGVGCCEPPHLDPRSEFSASQKIDGPRKAAMPQKQRDAIKKRKAAARLEEIHQMPLGDAARALMSDWASTKEGGAILSHAPQLPLHIFDDADHVEVATIAWRKYGGKPVAVALRQDRSPSDQVSDFERRLGRWVPCTILQHSDDGDGRNHRVKWFDDPWPPESWVPAVATIGAWQDRFVSINRLQGALIRRAACEERLRLRHFFASAPLCKKVIANLRNELFPTLDERVHRETKPWRNDVQLAKEMDEAERDYVIEMQGFIFAQLAKAAFAGEAPSRDVRFLSSDGTLDLPALDALAVKFAPGYCTAELDDFDRDAFVSKDTHRRFLLAKHALLHVAPEASEAIDDEDVEEGQHANWISSKWGTSDEPTADEGYRIDGNASPARKPVVLPLKAGLTREIHFPDDVVDKHDDGHFNELHPFVGSRFALCATQGAQKIIATHSLDATFLVHRPVQLSPAAFQRLFSEVLSKGLPAVEKTWPKDVGEALRTGLTGLVEPCFDPTRVEYHGDLFDTRKSPQEPLRRLLERTRYAMATELDTALRIATARYVEAVEETCRDDRFLRKPWFRLDLDIDIKDDLNDDMTASEKRKVQKQWSFAKKGQLRDADIAAALVMPLQKLFEGCARCGDPCVSALSHLQYVPPRAITCPWDGASEAQPAWVRDALRRLRACAATAADPVATYVRDVGAMLEREMRGRDSAELSLKRNYAEDVRSHDLDDEECELEPADTSLGRARNAVKKGGLGPAPPALPKDVRTIARELNEGKTTIESASASLDASPRRLCALTECDASIARRSLLRALHGVRRDTLDGHADQCYLIGTWCETRWRKIKAVLDTPCSDAETTVAVEKFVEVVPQLIKPILATARDASNIAELCALHGRPLNAVEGMCIARADRAWEPKVLKSLKRAKGECVRMRAQHTERLDDDRAEYEERLAEAAVLVRKACQYDAARFRGDAAFDGALKAVAKRSTDCKDAQESIEALTQELADLNRREGILSKDPTPADSLEALVDAFEPHRLLAAAGEHNVEATDAFASMRLGEARDEAFLAHLQPTYDLARRGGKILADRQALLDAANAKKAFNERLVAREDPAVVAACDWCGAGKLRESYGDVDRLVDAPAGPAWTKSLIAARVVASAERQVWLARCVQDLEGGLDAAAFRAKPVVDAVTYVVKGLAAGGDRDWVVKGDECSTLEMWGAELAALLGFPLGRGFEVRRITDSLVKNRHAVARLADAAHRCRRALALARRLEAVWNNQLLDIVPHQVTRPAERAKSGKMKDPKVVVAGNKLVKLEALFRAFDTCLVELDACRTGPLSGEGDNSPSVMADASVKNLASRLRAAEETLERWATVQGKWEALATVFAAGGDALRKQLPHEAATFSKVTRALAKCCAAAKGVNGRARVIEVQDRLAPLKNVLEDALIDVEEATRGIHDFAEARRLACARLCMVSEQDLWDLLIGDPDQDPRETKRRARKAVVLCFPGVSDVRFVGDSLRIEALVARHEPYAKKADLSTFDEEDIHETLELAKTEDVDAGGRCELWLNELEKGMKEAVQALTQASAEAMLKEPGRGAWCLQQQAASGLLAARCAFTAEAEGLLTDRGFVGTNELKRRQLVRINSVARRLKENHARHTFQKLQTFAAFEVEGRDAADSLIESVCASCEDFAWAARLRFYFENPAAIAMDGVEAGRVVAEAALSRRFCGDEYRGGAAGEALFITPNCERCMLEILAALRVGVTASLSGGTGKRSLAEKLGEMLAQPVVRLHCMDVDESLLRRVCTGLENGGLWLVLAGVARASSNVIASLAQHLASLENATRAEAHHPHEAHGPKHRRPPPGSREDGPAVILCFDGLPTRFPAALAARARPILRTAPDLHRVAALALAAHGFTSAGAIDGGRRLASAIRLLGDASWAAAAARTGSDEGAAAWSALAALASARPVRVVVACVNAAAAARAAYDEDALARGDGQLVAAAFVKVALKLASTSENASLLVRELVRDAFADWSGDVAPPDDTDDGREAARQELVEAGCDPRPEAIDVLVAARQALAAKRAVCVVGPAGCGKSRALRSLKATRVYPQALSSPDALDAVLRTRTKHVDVHLNRIREWQESETCETVVVDGVVDGLIGDVLCATLDNIGAPTAQGAHRSSMMDKRIIVETDDLSNASPALINRLQVVHYASHDATLDVSSRVALLVDDVMADAMPSLKSKLQAAIALLAPCAFQKHASGSCAGTFVALLDGLLLAPLRPRPGAPLPPLRACARAPEVVNSAVAWALLWAVGSVQPEQERLAFELEFVAKARPLVDFYPPLPEDNLYGYCLDIGRARWVPWADCLPKVSRAPPLPIPSTHHCGAIYLPTPAAAAGARLARLAMCSNASVLLIDGMRDGDAVAGAQAALQGLLGCVDGVATQFDRALITTQEELKAQAQKSPKKRKKKKKPGVTEGAYMKIELAPLEALEGAEPVVLPPGRGELPPAERPFDACAVYSSLGTTAADLRSAFERCLDRRRRGVLGGIGGPLFVRMDDVALLPRGPSEFVRQVLDAQSYTTGEGTMRLEDVSVVATASDGLPFDFDRVEKRGEVRHAPWCFQEIAPRLASRMCVLRVDDEGALGLATAFASVVVGQPARTIDALARCTVELVQQCAKVARGLVQPASSQQVVLDTGGLQYGRRDLVRILQGFLLVPPSKAAELTRLWAHECRRCLADRLSETGSFSKSDFEDLLKDAASQEGPQELGGQEFSTIVPEDSELDFCDMVLPDEEEGELGADPYFTTELRDDGVDDVMRKLRGEASTVDEESVPSYIPPPRAKPYLIEAAPPRRAYARLEKTPVYAAAARAKLCHGAFVKESLREDVSIAHPVSRCIHDVMRVARCLRRPGGHVVLLGGAASGRRTVARLACRLIGGEVMTASDLIRTQGSSSFREALCQALSRLGDVEPSPVGLPKPPPVPPPLPTVIEDEAPVVDAPAPAPAPAPGPAPAPAPSPAPAPAPAVEEAAAPAPPQSEPKKSRARTPSPARKARKKGKKKRAKKEAAEIPTEATEQHLLTIVVGDDELGDDAAAWRALAAAMVCDEAAATADDDDFDASRTGKAAARAARVRGRLRVVVCATVGDDNRATAALAAREPALFTSACVVRCGSDDAAARADLARSMLTEWPEDAPQLAADLHTISAKYVKATPGHFHAFLRDAARAHTARVAETGRRLDRLNSALTCWRAAKTAAAQLKWATANAGQIAAQQKKAAAKAKADREALEGRASELNDELTAALKSGDAATQDSCREELGAISQRMDDLDEANRKAKETSLAQGDAKGIAERRSTVAVQFAEALTADAVRWACEYEGLKAARENACRDALLAGAAGAYLGSLDLEKRLELWEAWRKRIDEVLPLSEPAALEDAPQQPSHGDQDPDALTVATLGALRDTLEWRLGAVYADEPGSGVSAACTLLCARWPLLIDPLRVARKFIMRCAVATGPQRGTFVDEETGEREPGVLSCRIGHADFSETLADALHGHWLIVEGVGEALLPFELLPVVQGGRAVAPKNFNLFLIADDDSISARLRGCCNVVKINPSAALSSRAMWECVAQHELPSLASTLDRLAFKRAVADRQAQAAEDRLFGALVTCAAPTDGEAIGGDHDAIGTNAIAEELKNAEGRLAAAKPDFQAEMRKHVHVWKLCGRDRRGPGIAAHLFDDREVLMDAEETIKDLGFKRGQLAEMREEDRQGRIALAPLRPVAARLGAMCLAIGSDLLFQSAGRAIASLNTPARLPPKAPTKENEEEKVHKRVAAVRKAVVRAASAVALRGCLSKELTALKARLCARPDWSDAERDEWRFVLTGEVGPATDPVEEDFMALKSGNNLVGGAKRRLEDLKLARRASLPNETRCGHWLFAADARARAKACGTLPALAGLEKTLDNWEKVLESATPYDEEFPSPYADLTPLQRLCVIRAVRFDALAAALEAFAAAELGQAEEDSALEKAASLDDESAPPIILRVSPEADDGREALQRVADANGVRLVVVGADSHAARAVAQAASEGAWLLVTDCATASPEILSAVAWAAVDQPLVERGVAGKPAHATFRLWLSVVEDVSEESHVDSLTSLRLVSAPSVKAVPQALLAASTVVALDAPRTLAESVERTTSLVGDDEGISEAALRCATTLAVCGERRDALGSLGWNGGGVSQLSGAASHAIQGVWPFIAPEITPPGRRSLLKAVGRAVKGGRWKELQTLIVGIGATSCGGDVDQRLLEFVAKSIGSTKAQQLLDWPEDATTWTTAELPEKRAAEEVGGAPILAALRGSAESASATSKAARAGSYFPETVLDDVRLAATLDLCFKAADVFGPRLDEEAPRQVSLEPDDAPVADEAPGAAARPDVKAAVGSVEEDIVAMCTKRREQAFKAACAWARRTKNAKPDEPDYTEAPDPPTEFDGILLRERDRLRILASKVFADVAALQSSLVGSAPASDEERLRLGDVASSLRRLEIPAAWRNASAPPETMASLGDWFDHVKARARLLTGWYEALAPPSPIPLDLLAEPAAVVHAVRLQAARHWGVPLDEVWLDSRAKPEEDDDQSDLDSFKGDEVSRSRASTPAASRAATPGDDLIDEKMPVEPPKLVVSITGMTIEGARWDQFAPDGGALRECERIDGPFDPAPVVSLIPLAREAFFDEDEEAERLSPKGVYRCPVFASTRHTEVLFWINLKAYENTAERNRTASECLSRPERDAGKVLDQPFFIVRGVAAVLAVPPATVIVDT